MMSRRRAVPVMLAAAVALAQIGFLSWVILGRAAILRDGQEVLLEVRPVDPRDLLRGDYVVLTYNVTTIPTETIENLKDDEAAPRTRPIFVRLREGENGIWQPVAASFFHPPVAALQDGDVDMRGMVQPYWSPDSVSVDVDYGIERFYVPEGEGRAIERDMNVRPFRMKVAVASDGTAQIKSFHDGETMLYAEPLY